MKVIRNAYGNIRQTYELEIDKKLINEINREIDTFKGSFPCYVCESLIYCALTGNFGNYRVEDIDMTYDEILNQKISYDGDSFVDSYVESFGDWIYAFVSEKIWEDSNLVDQEIDLQNSYDEHIGSIKRPEEEHWEENFDQIHLGAEDYLK